MTSFSISASCSIGNSRTSLFLPVASCHHACSVVARHRQLVFMQALVTSPMPPESSVDEDLPTSSSKNLQDRVKEWIIGRKHKEKVSSLGMAAFISYGITSNLMSGACLTCAWLAFIKETGVSPLASGQWAHFVAFYGGLWTLRNMTQGARIGIAIATAPIFEVLLDWVTARVGGNRKAAFAVLIGLIAVATATGLFSAIYLGGGFPGGIGPLP